MNRPRINCKQCGIACYCNERCRLDDLPGHQYVCYKNLADRLRGICVAATITRDTQQVYIISVVIMTHRDTHYRISPFASETEMYHGNCACCSQGLLYKVMPASFGWEHRGQMKQIQYYLCYWCTLDGKFICPATFTTICGCWRAKASLILSLAVYIPRDVLRLVMNIMQRIQCK